MFKKNFITVFALLSALYATPLFGQGYSENFGTAAPTTGGATLKGYESYGTPAANQYQYKTPDTYTMTSTKGGIYTTTAKVVKTYTVTSSGYAGASGGSALNIPPALGGTADNFYQFHINEIDITNKKNLTLNFGFLKNNSTKYTSSYLQVTVTITNGETSTPYTYDLTPGSLYNKWILVTQSLSNIAIPASGTTKAKITFVNKTTPNTSVDRPAAQIFIDDVSLSEGSVTPVTFGNVSAQIKGKKLLVNWNTFSEKNNDYFEVQASKNGIDFKTVGNVKSKSEGGDSNQELKYNFEVDTTAANGLLALSFLFGFLVFDSRKLRAKINIPVAVIMVLFMVGFFSCTKSYNDAGIDNNGFFSGTGKNNQVFVRVVQHDLNGNTDASATVQAVEQK